MTFGGGGEGAVSQFFSTRKPGWVFLQQVESQNIFFGQNESNVFFQ